MKLFSPRHFVFVLKDVIAALSIFTKYNIVWQQDRNEQLKAFLARRPEISQFENQLKYYEDLAANLNACEKFLPVGALTIYTGQMIFLL